MRKRPPVRKTSTLEKKHFVALNTKPSMVWDKERSKLIRLDDKTRHNRGILELILWYESPSEVGCLRKIDKRIAGP